MKHECNNYRPTFTQKISIYISVGYSFYIITFAIVMAISLIVAACNKEDNTIKLTFYAMSSSSLKNRVTQPEGLTIIIDTIKNTIHTPLKGKIGNKTSDNQVEEESFLFYNKSTESIDYIIDKMKHKNNAIIFDTSYGDIQFQTLINLYDSVFAIREEDEVSYIYMGSNGFKSYNRKTNNAKEKAIKSLRSLSFTLE